MVKLQFEFTIIASPKDEKSSILVISSIKTEDEKTYTLQDDNRYIAKHT